MKFAMDLTREPFCRSMSRLLLRLDREPDTLYLGVTPDGGNPGRLRVSRIGVCRGREEAPFRITAGDGKMRIEAGDGFAEMALALPNRLLIHGRGLSLLFGNGQGAAVFMGGGSAVQDALNPGGAMLAVAGTKLRFIPRKGTVEVSAHWDLNTLSDPDPRVYLCPDENGELDAVLYESDYDELCPEDGMTVDEAAKETVAEFEAFLRSLRLPSEDELFLRAAYAIWASLQPDRDLSEKRITAPEYVTGRDGAGTAKLSDSVLLALLFKDKKTAFDRLGSFLQYAQPDGLVPREANNKGFLMEAELPLYGFVLKELLDDTALISEELYAALGRAFAWWHTERYCPERRLFYYLHRYEPGCCKRLPFADTAPEFAPDLNAMMLLWLDAMAFLAKRLGKEREQAAYEGFRQDTRAALIERLWDGEKFIFTDIQDRPVCAGHPRALLPVLVSGSLPGEIAAALGAAVPDEVTEDVIYLAYALREIDRAKLKRLAGQVCGESSKLGFMNVRQALTLLLVCGAAC